MNDVDRKCLKFVYEVINRFRERREFGKEVLRYSRRASNIVLSDGLSATLAFVYSRNKEAWNAIGDSIIKWLHMRGLLENVLIDEDKVDPIRAFGELSTMDDWKMLIAEMEATRILGWLSKLCEGEFGGEG